MDFAYKKSVFYSRKKIKLGKIFYTTIIRVGLSESFESSLSGYGWAQKQKSVLVFFLPELWNDFTSEILRARKKR